jgi:hypothetical protein
MTFFDTPRTTFREHALEDYRVARKYLRLSRRMKSENNVGWADIYRENAALHLRSARSWRRVLNTLKPKRS